MIYFLHTVGVQIIVHQITPSLLLLRMDAEVRYVTFYVQKGC